MRSPALRKGVSLGAAKLASTLASASVRPVLSGQNVAQSSSQQLVAQPKLTVTPTVAFSTAKAPSFSSFYDLMPERQSTVTIAPVAATKLIAGKRECLDGNEAAASVAYQLSDCAFVFPITPATPMAENTDAWATTGRKNIDGQVVQVTQMQSEAGVAGALCGAVLQGARVASYTCSQGLLLMVPCMYKLSGEKKPCVIHVASRAVFNGGGSMFADNSDVMATRQTGFSLLASTSVQECQDFSLVSHLATLRASLPFLHFFDGIRTSHEITKIETLPKEVISALYNTPEMKEARQRHMDNSLHPWQPAPRGPALGIDVYMQAIESMNKEQLAVPDIVQDCMNQLAQYTGRSYHLFDYVGAPDAKNVIVMMGSGSQTVEEVVNYMNSIPNGPRVGLIKVRLFRPFSVKHFLAALPASCERVCVLERCKEGMASHEPLCQDVMTAYQEARLEGLKRDLIIVGGRFGLGGKEFNSSHAKAVFANLMSSKPRNRFSVGIEDDVTFMSLPVKEELHTVPKGTVECIFWGMGSDGTVGANKEAIAIVGDNTKLNVQGYFWYDAFKSGAATVSHLRFGPKPITSEYLVQAADYLACHHSAWVGKYDMLKSIKPGGVFVLNTPIALADINTLPASVKRSVAQKKVQFYIINARKIAESVGLGKRINMIMQVCFFALSKVMPLEEAIGLLKKAIAVAYGNKGEKIVKQNLDAVDHALQGLQRVEYDAEAWLNAEDTDAYKAAQAKTIPPPDVRPFLEPVFKLNGDSMPVSLFENTGKGVLLMSQTKYLKRTTSPKIPFWLSDKCTQCNYCSIVCPHACIRPFLQSEEHEKADRAKGVVPEFYQTKKLTGGKEAEGLRFSVQISPTDCTGCGLCVSYCPDKALEFRPIKQHFEEQTASWDYARALPSPYGSRFDKTTVRGSQFQQPLLEFSGACDGCGETPYVKLLTQLFGTRLVIANSTGCSSIWSGYYGGVPYTTTPEGKGPAWGTSLFENNAEYGYGLLRANQQLRARVNATVQKIIAQGASVLSAPFVENLRKWTSLYDTPAANDECTKIAESIVAGLDAEIASAQSNKVVADLLTELKGLKNGLPSLSFWTIGGDGWAYDIGSAGVDHVMAMGERVRLLIMDNEMYSNTGGQRSKATPLGAVAKLIGSGNKRMKKDLGQMAMSYGDVYVASIAMGANMSQTIKAFVEADSYPGPAVILAYVPCAMHGNELFLTADRDRVAVDSGYWSLYRYDPRLIAQGKNPFQLDSKKIKSDLLAFLKQDGRFQQLARQNKELSKALQAKFKDAATHKRAALREHAEASAEGAQASSKKESGSGMLILFGSETGNSEALANRLATAAKARGVNATVSAMDDYDFDSLATCKQHVTFILSTCGQGKFPANGEAFYRYLCDQKPDLKDLKFSVFGLGDSNYVYFCKSAVELEAKLKECGATEVGRRGVGNDQDEDKFETGWEDWEPEMWSELKVAPPPLPSGPAEAPYTVTLSAPAKTEPVVPMGAQPVPLLVNKRITPPQYDRDIRHMEFDIKGKNMPYAIGDCLAIYGKNDPAEVADFLKFYGVDGAQVATVAPVGSAALKPGFPNQPLTVNQIFEDVLDLFGRPTRRFYNELALFATNADEKAALLKFAQDKNEYKKGLAESVTYADILRAHPSAKPSLAHLVNMLPLIKPRYYSIASSNNMYPDALHLCVVLVDWKTKSGKLRKGLTTNYISRLNPEQGAALVNCAIRRSAVEMPPTQQTPVIMAGLGTGVAPFRAFVQDRAYFKRKGEQTGPMVLYYGCRYRKQDFLYAEEFEQYAKEGVLSENGLRPACSRDQKKKIYVQHLIEEDAARTHDLLMKQDGFFYICGPAGNVPADVREAVRKSFVKCGGMTKDQAEKTIMDLVIKGRYNVEAW